MTRTKIVSMALTEEEYKRFYEEMLAVEKEVGKRLSVSAYLRHTFSRVINGDSPERVPIIVSSEPTHTDSKQKNNDAPWNDLEFN